MDKKDKIAIVTQDGKQIRYEELVLFCEEFAKRFGEKQLLLIRCKISPYVILAYVAAIRHHITVMMVEYDRKYSNVMECYVPEYVWQEDKGENLKGYVEIWKYGEYILWKRSESLGYIIHKDIALLLSTSGSTGSGRFVKISYKNIECNTKAIIEALRIQSDDVAMVMLPLSYTYGLSIVNTYLYSGATLLVPTVPMIHKTFWDFFNENGGTAISGVPYTYEILSRMNVFAKGLPFLRLATLSGGKISKENERYVLNMSIEKGFNFASMYGQTEATARISCCFLNKCPEKAGSVGKTIAGVKVSVLDGELICCGDSVAMGYADSYSDLVIGDEWKGTLATGDIGEIDQDGFIYITGRLKRFAKINGYRISLDELERILSEKIGKDCVCLENKDKIYIMIECEKEELEKACVLEMLKNITGLNKNCFEICYVQSLPRNSRGKIVYEEFL